MKRILVLLGWACLGLVVGVNAHAAEGTVVLDTYSYWRVHVTLRPIPFGTSTDAKPDEKGCTAIDSYSRGVTVPIDRPRTPLPPADWMKPDFDDSRWWRDPGPFFGGKDRGIYGCSRPHLNRWGVGQPSSLALLCARGKFNVVDPAQVKSLRLAMEFRGGVVVYLNGKEVKRLHMRDGEIDPLTLAEDYPVKASLKDGNVHNSWSAKRTDPIEGRVRKAQDVEIPVQHLRKGVNVLALEVHRAAMPPEMLKVGRKGKGRTRGWFWNTVALIDVKLTASGSGLAPNASRPKGLRVWNANALEAVYASDYGDPNEPLRPMRIVGTRNGVFSGQVIVGSDAAIRGLSAEISALKHKDGAGEIPAGAIEVRWPRATIKTDIAPKTPHPFTLYKHSTLGRFEALEAAAPAEVPVYEAKSGAGVAGAVQTVWLKVHVPGDAAPGVYEGKLTVKAGGAKPVEVPVALEVHGFRLPDPPDFATWVDFIEIPESLAFHYKVPLWSEEHWKLIEASLKLAASVGDRTLYVPLITRTNFGNTESMVRWTGKDGAYAHDFGLAEKYLDSALAAGLRPQVVCIQVWDYHVGMNTAKGISDDKTAYKGGKSYKIGTGVYGQLTVKEPQPIPVSLLDPKSGKVTELAGPKYVDPEVEAFWAPVAKGILEVLKKRGLEKNLMMGLAGDYIPPEVAMKLWRKLLPEAPWVTMAHGRTNDLFGIPIGYSTTVFGARYAVDPEIKRFYGWQAELPLAYFPRYFHNGFYPPAFERIAFEKGISGNMRGMGRQSLDDFADRRKVKGGTYWGSLTMAPAWLAASAKGPISSVRFEMGREGIQECEARIYIERALVDEKLRAKLGDALAARCRALVDERTRHVILADEKGENGRVHTSSPGGPLGFDWFAGSDWQSRSSELYAAAAEVAKALGAP